jgi:hypothetical protein
MSATVSEQEYARRLKEDREWREADEAELEAEFARLQGA